MSDISLAQTDASANQIVEQAASNEVVVKGKTLTPMLRKELVIGAKSILAFMDANGRFYCHLRQTASMISKHHASPAEFMETETFKALRSKDQSVDRFVVKYVDNVGNNISPYYTVLSIELATEYFLYWARVGHQPAIDLVIALASEALKIRCEAVFVGVSPNVEDIQRKTDAWLAARFDSKSVHGAFTNHCLSNAISGKDAHNMLTMLIFGQTASQAKLFNDLIGDDPDIGLDHQADPDGLQLLTMAKVKFCSYRSQSWQQNCLRAVKEARAYLNRD